MPFLRNQSPRRRGPHAMRKVSRILFKTQLTFSMVQHMHLSYQTRPRTQVENEVTCQDDILDYQFER